VYVCMVLKIKLRFSYMLGKPSMTELYPQAPQILFFMDLFYLHRNTTKTVGGK
jgi:hypothetical protein